MAITSYESATVAYDPTKGYVNPQTGTVYGVDPPAGAWRVPEDPKSGTSAATGAATSTQAQANGSTSVQIAGQTTKYVGAGTQANPKVGDRWVNADGSINSTFTAGGWVSGAVTGSVQATAATTAGTAAATTIAPTTAVLPDITGLFSNPMVLVGLAVVVFMMFSGGDKRGRG